MNVTALSRPSGYARLAQPQAISAEERGIVSIFAHLVSLGDTYVVIVIRPFISVGCPLLQEVQADEDRQREERHREMGCQTTCPRQTY